MLLDQEAITHHQEQLAVHRRRLEHLFQQYITFGAYTPPYIVLDIEKTQAEIRSIKALLREQSVPVKDHPDDDRPVQVAAPLPPALHQLRAPVADFVGREQEIDKLMQALTKGGGAAISGVRGMGGIGKTELAYVAANRLKDTFADAQLVIDLRGTSNSPLTPKAALQQVISSFEREAKLPDDLSKLEMLYRAQLSNKRVLIVADDARDAAQVRPLLPPPGCVLLVTSRNKFSLPGMQTVDLEVLSPTDAVKLVLEICPRVGQYAGELAKLCGYLPLALRVSAGLLKENEIRDIRSYLEQLQVARLKHLMDPDNADDSQASVEASLRLSFEALKLDAQWALCKLSLYPLNLRKEWAEKIVWPEGDAPRILELLQRCNFLEWHSGEGTLNMHILIRLFSAERCIEMIEKDIEKLHHRGEHFKEIKYTQLLAYAYGIIGDMARAQVLTDDVIEILHGFKNNDAELRELMIFGDSYWLQKNWNMALVCYKNALEVARRIESKNEQARILWRLGWIYQEQGEIEQAIDCYEASLLLIRDLDDQILENQIRIGLMRVYLATGNIIQFNHLASRIAMIKGRKDDIDDILAEAQQALEDAVRAIKSE